MAGTLAFVCAMPMEASPLRRRLSLRGTRISTLEAYEGSLAGRPVVAVVTGMGTELASRGVVELLAAVEVDRVVVVGITGALHEETPIASLVQPESVVEAATGTEFRPHPLGPGTPSGVMWTSDGLTTDPDQLAVLRGRGVVALDMETAAIARRCEERGLPWSVFRAVSDRATDGSVDEDVFGMSNPDGTPNLRAVVSYFARNPTRIPLMARMARDARNATVRAADAAIDAVAGPAAGR